MAILREQILQQLVSQLEGITTAGDAYHTDLGQNVSLWRATKFQPAELPALNVKDKSDAISSEAMNGPANETLHELAVEISVLCKSGVTDAVVRQMIYDVYKAIGNDPSFGGNAIDCDQQGDEMQVDQEEDKIGGATITISIKYVTNKFSES